MIRVLLATTVAILVLLTSLMDPWEAYTAEEQAQDAVEVYAVVDMGEELLYLFEDGTGVFRPKPWYSDEEALAEYQYHIDNQEDPL